MSDTDTTKNRGNVDGDGYTIAPYASITLSDTFSLDAVGGISKISYDLDRLDPLSSAKITGSTDGDRWFGSVNLVGNWVKKDVTFGARLGSMYISETQDAFTESDSTSVAENTVSVGNVNAGVRLGFNGKVANPYIAGTYSFDFDDAGGTSYDARNTYGGSVGVDFRLSDNWFANIEGGGTWKTDVETKTGSATLRYQKKF